MAKPSNRRPWVLEMSTSTLPGMWFEVDAFSDHEEAEFRRNRLVRDAQSGIEFRVRHWKETV